MPIDFNAHFMLNRPTNVTQRVISKQSIAFKQPDGDVYVKNIDTDSDFDGIKISQKSFGKIEKTGEVATLYTIKNKNGASVDLSSFGATITSVKIPDKDGKIKEVAQGYDDVSFYEKYPIGHAGGTIGPYANKIMGGKFNLNGKEYTLECNKDKGQTHSHGGSEGFDTKNWKSKKLKDGVVFTYTKKDMEIGYPGNVTVNVTYKLDNKNNLHILYDAKTDKDTVLNLTNHSYFNLEGAENAFENSVYEHTVTLPNSSKITVNNEIAVPTGEFREVKGTPFDFSTPKKIGDVINSEDEQMKIGAGFDQNYCVDGYDGKTLVEVADIKSYKTGIGLKVLTNLPGFQFYTANHLGKPTQPQTRYGTKYEKRSAFCVEPQFFPNAINTDSFSEKGILRTNEKFSRKIIYAFETTSD